MRNSSLFFGFGLIVLISCGFAAAQDAAKPRAIQVTIGPDGVVKVIDVNTGQEIGKPAAKAQAKPGGNQGQQVQQEQQGQHGQNDNNQDQDPRQKIERILKAKRLEQEGQEKRGDGQQDKKSDGNSKTIKIVIGPDGTARIITDQDEKKRIPEPRGSIDQKLDQILKQLGDLRRDVDAIKKKLDDKKGGVILWDVKPAPGKEPPAKEKKELKIKIELPKDKPAVDPEVQKRLDAIIKELEKKRPDIELPKSPIDPEVQKQIDRILKQLKEKGAVPETPVPPRVAPPPPAQKIEELQRSIDQLRRQIDQLKRESQDKKSK
jgi:hypothetical protein